MERMCILTDPLHPPLIQWNRLDLLALIVCYLSMILTAFTGALLIRLLRLIRLFRIAKKFPALRAVVEGVRGWD